MSSSRSYEEDVAFWLGFVDGEETDEAHDVFLAHLDDLDIYGLGDSYNDGRIDKLATSYVALREMVRAHGIGATE